ncbi:MAG: dihydrofolate reductase [Saprospiraceae bacterium]|nr:dihydrofolate reductase [Saprospiraceae bacterium]|tara:strand:- start:5632 stop:6135 length:504 start_codon:yes stop_codon:yes gene_type:complete
MIISTIVARSKNNIIGKDNSLPWHLPADLKWFRSKTIGHHVIMGRKSFESLPGPLKGRTIITVTQNKDYFSSDCIVKHSITEALAYAKKHEKNEVLILGGGIIYELTKNLWDKMYMTDVDVEIDGDTSFAELEMDDWVLKQEEAYPADDKNVYNYTFRTYTRKEHAH